MANKPKHTSTNNYDTGKLILVVLALLLAVAFVAISIWQGTANFAKWNFSSTKQEQSSDGGELSTGDSGLLAPDEHEANGISFKKMSIPVELYNDYGVSAAAETALQLTVTPTPANADMTDGKFTIAFKNAASTWAKGKTLSEYVTLSQSDSTHATVSCLKAFSEQIIVTYTVTGENGQVTATYPLDYAKRITDIEWYTGGSISNSPIWLTVNADSFMYVSRLESQSGIGTLTGHFTYSDYTVDDTFSISEIKSELSEEYLHLASDRGYNQDWNSTTFAKGSGSDIQVNYDSIKSFLGMNGSGGMSSSMKEALTTAEQSFGGWVITVSMTISGTHSTHESSYQIEMTDFEGLSTLVQSVQIKDSNGQSSHIF